jgi:integrase
MASLTLEEINNQLRPGGIRLEPRGKAQLIRLIAVLPSKEQWEESYQQKISLGLSAEIPYQLKEAHRIAIALLSLKTTGWDWTEANYILGRETEKKSDLRAGIDSYREHRLASGIKPDQVLREYKNTLVKLIDISDTPSLKLFQTFIGQYPKNSSSRKFAYETCKRLCEFNQWDYDLRPYKSTYGQHQVKRRELPGDEDLINVEANFTGSQEWRWVLRVILCYGLRNHEAHFCSVSPDYPYPCSVTRGKTGARVVYPYPLEWVEEWKLWDRSVPNINLDRTFRAIGQITTESLKNGGAPKPYTFRHCYSIRGHVTYNQPPRIMAGLMGHSIATWINVYSKWLPDDMLKNSYLESLKKPGEKPLPDSSTSKENPY